MWAFFLFYKVRTYKCLQCLQCVQRLHTLVDALQNGTCIMMIKCLIYTSHDSAEQTQQHTAVKPSNKRQTTTPRPPKKPPTSSLPTRVASAAHHAATLSPRHHFPAAPRKWTCRRRPCRHAKGHRRGPTSLYQTRVATATHHTAEKLLTIASASNPH